MKDQYERIFGDKQKILVVMAHPDDAEIFAGGTIARLTADGKEVRIVKMTSGNKGSRQEKVTEIALRSIRENEDAEAVKVMGIKPDNNVHLHLGDGEIENDLQTIGKLAREIRLFKPDLIITHNPEDVVIRFDKENNWVNHRDHRNTGKSAIDAAYPYSRDILFFPEQLAEPGVESHSTSEFLLVDYWDHPDVIGIDIEKYVPVKVAAIASHKSQYPEDKAKSSEEFFDKTSDGWFEKFRYVVAD